MAGDTQAPCIYPQREVEDGVTKKQSMQFSMDDTITTPETRNITSIDSVFSSIEWEDDTYFCLPFLSLQSL